MSGPTPHSHSLSTPISQVMVVGAGDRTEGVQFIRGRASVADLALPAARTATPCTAARLNTEETRGRLPGRAGRRRRNLRGRARRARDRVPPHRVYRAGGHGTGASLSRRPPLVRVLRGCSRRAPSGAAAAPISTRPALAPRASACRRTERACRRHAGVGAARVDGARQGRIRHISG